MKYRLGERTPEIATSCYVAPSADLIGSVVMHENASVWFNCVLRADNATITVGENSNIQDGAVLHVDPEFPIEIGRNVTIGHKAMIHGCCIGDNTLIGINAVVLNGARIGKNCIVGANALVTENMVIPDGQMALGSPARVLRAVDRATSLMLAAGAEHYVDKGRFYTEKLLPLD